MKITLIRHAKVLIDYKKRVNYKELQAWLKSYDTAAISQSIPSLDIQNILQNSDYILASKLSRTTDSLRLLNIEPNSKSELFNEVELISLNIPIIKLKPKYWLALLRIAMFINVKPIIGAKERAKNASIYLESLAKEYKNITLLGHGALNWFIAKELEKSGWKLTKENGHGNWSYKVLTYLTRNMQ